MSGSRSDTPPRAVGVFCASADNLEPAFGDAARALGLGLAERGMKMIYGGSQVGLMGIAARAAMAKGGEVIGVLPERLIRNETAERSITELILVDTLQARKTLMAQFSDCFAVLPGGLGTLDEVVTEMLANDLGQHDKSIYLIDVAGYWRGFMALIEHMDRHRTLRPRGRQGLHMVDSVPAFFAAIGR